MREVKSSSGFAMNAYVILDEHFHWIITPGKSPNDGFVRELAALAP
jgi:hypothetical protein